MHPPQPYPTAHSAARPLLWCGVLAGPFYLLVGYGQALAREGFDIRRHPLSVLANGDLGWIQVSNFLLTSVLVLFGAVGLRQVLRSTRGGTWGPLLLGTYGLGLFGAGVFPAAPMQGFPPGASPSAALGGAGLLHFVFGGIGFYALIASCFVFARRAHTLGDPGWAAASVATGTLFFVSFAAIASGNTSATAMLAFYAVITLAWAWHCALHVRHLR
ncbi:MAG: DUF998 domain-containing protein [Gemmatimonadaceae bacterium]|nr:DUF998 domain-containing protein [Gemmatimonadaceae bacterium]MCW5826523.1 DUF998 domain-containing protein [Gemmatimonadaceae bacterium]